MIEAKSISPVEFLTPTLDIKLSGNVQGVIVGYASTFGGDADSYHDIIAPGAFAQSLSDHKQHQTSPAMLWAHDLKQPIGSWTSVVEDEYGLRVEGRLTLDVPRAREAFALAKDGALAFSIGYRPVMSGIGKAGERILQKVDLVEISLVSVPANRNARIISVKSARDIKDPRAFEEFLREAGFPRAFAKAITASGFKAAAGLCDAEDGRSAELARMIRASSNSIKSSSSKD